MVKKRVTVRNRMGLHARACAQVITIAKRFESEIVIECGPQKARATSIMDLISLAAGQGNDVTIYAHGRDEEQAVEKVAELVERGFFD
jgi:phosphocarrier protein